jgi:hypothetical protein
MYRRVTAGVLFFVLAAGAASAQRALDTEFTFQQVRSYPFPTELTASATGARIAWAFNEQGQAITARTGTIMSP